MWTSKVPGKEMAHDSLVLFRFRLASGATIALSSRRVWIHVKAGVCCKRGKVHKYLSPSAGSIHFSPCCEKPRIQEKVPPKVRKRSLEPSLSRCNSAFLDSSFPLVLPLLPQPFNQSTSASLALPLGAYFPRHSPENSQSVVARRACLTSSEGRSVLYTRSTLITLCQTRPVPCLFLRQRSLSRRRQRVWLALLRRQFLR